MDDEAKKLAGRAGKQSKHAAQNAGRAARAAAEPVIEHAADVATDAFEELEEAAHETASKARQINPGVLGRLTGDLGIGLLATSVSIYTGMIAVNTFRKVLSGRSVE